MLEKSNESGNGKEGTDVVRRWNILISGFVVSLLHLVAVDGTERLKDVFRMFVGSCAVSSGSGEKLV